MDPIADKAAGGDLSSEDRALERRLERNMIAAVVLAVLVSVPFAQWRVTAGLMLGGALSVLNYKWLSSSIGAALSVSAQGRRPRLGASRYVLRYLVVGATVFLAHKAGLIAVGAAIAGLCSFVAALMAEAVYQLYFAIIQREDN